ncbi:MAG: hypothetical protein COT26_01520 [Candidatus Kerfeldbacteria bacterium CG08_land_8_20_14_0_20_43_14]|uniref:Uncharacterized protein n=1 Tax=Candidatus Kerfeldbacteria bacterium CG08_land_8_20_14_0_20_43_14 TaxID=2014246 RepID=A0A2H0YSP9_9BACT|nr:MAG: hypothetical protein COT26_01520 [Candidatus Kerfeldbacteria bacterium CG08_land_8_20_14_0_20_43_14]
MADPQIPFDPDFDSPQQPASQEQPAKRSIFSGVNSKFAFVFGLTIGLVILLTVVIILLINR